MKTPTILFVIFFCAFLSFGQGSTNTEAKLYQGEDYFPYIFEAYRIDNVKNPLGFGVSTNIVEQPTGWEETFKVNLATVGEFEIGMKIISDIDIKTGLLKKQRYEMGEDWGEAIFGDDMVTLSQNRGNKTETYTYKLPEKIYPCYFSAAFTSYLPLNGNFSGSFKCFIPDFGDIRKSIVTKFSVQEIESEKIATPRGMQDCYVVLGAGSKTRDITDLDGKSKKDGKKYNSKYADIAQKFNSKVWVNKKTRQSYYR